MASKSKELNQLNETGRRKVKGADLVNATPKNVAGKTNRRRHIDPTTCERDYSDSEIEFMRAMDEYKRTSGRMFPTCSEILEVFLKLGYQKVIADPISASNPTIGCPVDSLTMTDSTSVPN